MLKAGDILVQKSGEPWVSLAKVFCGKPNPHAIMISRIGDGKIFFLENGKTVGKKAMIQESELPVSWVENFEVIRPNCGDEIKQKAIKWVQEKSGQPYSFLRLIQVGLLYRLGFSDFEGIDDEDVSMDSRRMICSETIAMAYYRSGYDVAPNVSNRQTMPWDLLNDSSSKVNL
jgi:hypothetical protein